MSTLSGLDTEPHLPPTAWTPSPLADAFGALASATAKVDKFEATIAPLAVLIETLESRRDRQGLMDVDEGQLRAVLEHASQVAQFGRAQFTSDDTARDAMLDSGLRPFAWSSGLLSLTAGRLTREARNRHLRGNTEIAINSYKRVAWDVAREVEGLGNWPLFLTAIRAHRDEIDEFDLANDDEYGTRKSILQSVFDDVDARWVGRIGEWFYNEGIYMASLQSPELSRLANELINGELEQARADLIAAFSGSPRAVETSEATTTPIEDALFELEVMELELNSALALGREWERSLEAEVADVDIESLDLDELVQVLEIEDFDPDAPTVAVVVAHNDDEARASGFIAEQRAKGNNVLLIIMTNSALGEPQSDECDTPFDWRNFVSLRKLETGNASTHPRPDDEATRNLGPNKVIACNYNDSGMHDNGQRFPSGASLRLGDQSVGAVAKRLEALLRAHKVDAALAMETLEPYLHKDHVMTDRALYAAVNSMRRRGHDTSLYYLNLTRQSRIDTYRAFGLEKLVGPMRESQVPVTADIQLGMKSGSVQHGVHWAYESQVAKRGKWTYLAHPRNVTLRQAFPEPVSGVVDGELRGSFVPAGVQKLQEMALDEAIPMTRCSAGPPVDRPALTPIGLAR